MNLFMVAVVVLVTLKLSGVIAISWLAAFAPLWIPTLILLLCCLAASILDID